MPAAFSTIDYDLTGFDFCDPFADYVFTNDALQAALPEPGINRCTYCGQRFTATIALQTGRSLSQISNDPAFRPGRQGLEAGNAYRRIKTPDLSTRGQLFLAVGPSYPDQVISIEVITEQERTRISSGARVHTFFIVDDLLVALSTVLRTGGPQLEPPGEHDRQ